MTTLDGFFRGPVDSLSHPRLKHWKSRLAQADTKATLTLHRPEAGFGLTQTDMNLQFVKDGELQPLETVDWDDDLNTGLIQLRVRSETREQEAERFALGLRGALRKVEREFGDGYLNAVLVELVRDSDLTRYPEIDEALQHAHSNPPNREGKSYGPCREAIADAISGRAHELKDKLGYSENDAKPILVDAIARYLDERFSVTSRRRLGLL